MSSSRELLELYLGERSLCVSSRTLREDRYHLHRFLLFLEELDVGQVGQVSWSHLSDYEHRLATVPGPRKLASVSYRQGILGRCRSFLLWALARGYTLVDFTDYPLPLGVAKTPRLLTRGEVGRLLEVPDCSQGYGRRDRLILESFYTLGLRRGESYRLDVSDLNLQARTVRVMGKGARERFLPFSERLRELFQGYLDSVRPSLNPESQEEALWISFQSGKRLNSGFLYTMLKRYAKEAGLGQVYPHLLRHCCATHLLEGGAGLRQIQFFLGHKNLNSTKCYTQVQDLELRKEVQRCHPRYGHPGGSRD